MDEQWLTTEEAGRRLGKTDRQVRRDCHNNILNCRRDGKQLLVDAESIEALMQKQMSDPKECPQEDVRETPKNEDVSDVREILCEEVPDSVAGTLISTPDKEGAGTLQAWTTEEDSAQEMPTDISALSEKLRTSKLNLQQSQEAVLGTADLLFQRLCFEYGRNRDIEERLRDMISELNIQPRPQSKWGRILRKFRMVQR